MTKYFVIKFPQQMLLVCEDNNACIISDEQIFTNMETKEILDIFKLPELKDVEFEEL
jgi:hypothetical protein